MIEFLLGMLFGGISVALIHALLDYANQLEIHTREDDEHTYGIDDESR